LSTVHPSFQQMSSEMLLRIALTLFVVKAAENTCVSVGGVETCYERPAPASLLQSHAKRNLVAQVNEQSAQSAANMVEEMSEYEQISLDELEAEDKAAEKHNTANFDCADEVILRLAMAESFYGPSYDKCVEQMTNKTFAEGGSGENAMRPAGSGGSGLSREQVQQKVRERCITKQGHGVALGPRLIRMTFHDSADYNNSMLYDGSEVPLEKTGVDSCLRTALLSVGLNQKNNDDDIEDVAKGDPNHNRGLDNAIKWVLHMASASKLSQPDIQVLGAVVAAEAWLAGPELGANFGRIKGDCQKVSCSSEDCWDKTTPFFKQPVAEPVGSGMFCPMTNTLDPLKNVLGLSMAELIALQGSHSVGGVIVCSGLGNVASGPYCPDKCGIPPGKFQETGNLDGTAFDDTPGKLDNRYYQLLIREHYENLPACDEARREFPQLSKRGLSRDDKSKTCTQGVKYDAENMCEVEACVQKCAKSRTCLEAQNMDDDDVDKYKEAWKECLYCKKMCSGSHAARQAMQAFKSNWTSCRDGCQTSASCTSSANFTAAIAECRTVNTACTATCSQNDACAELTTDTYKDLGTKEGRTTARTTCRNTLKACFATVPKKGKAKWSGRKTCRSAYRTCVKPLQALGKLQRACRSCKESCSAAYKACRGPLTAQRKLCSGCRKGCLPTARALQNSIYNASAVTKKPARWCKRLSPTKTCLDASIKMPINGGWGDCPENQRMSIPNTGAGRLTIIQNLERWTKFHGLYKRIMVLPSDWSHLGSTDGRKLFQRYADDEDDWKNMYKQAFNKMASLGSAGKLKKCKKVECTMVSGFLSCPVRGTGIGNAQNKKAMKRMNSHRASLGLPAFVRPASLLFDPAECSPPLKTTASCEITGGYGVKAKITCVGQTAYCATTEAKATEVRIAEEWKEGGGQEAPCNDNNGNETGTSMLETDVSPQ